MHLFAWPYNLEPSGLTPKPLVTGELVFAAFNPFARWMRRYNQTQCLDSRRTRAMVPRARVKPRPLLLPFC